MTDSKDPTDEIIYLPKETAKLLYDLMDEYRMSLSELIYKLVNDHRQYQANCRDRMKYIDREDW